MAGLRLTKDYQQDVFAEDDYSSVKGPDGVKEPALQPPETGVGRPYMVSEAVGTLSGPAIYPAFYWDFGPMSAVNVLPAAMICANLDRLELFVRLGALPARRAGHRHRPRQPPGPGRRGRAYPGPLRC
jgi:hypothetical protein